MRLTILIFSLLAGSPLACAAGRFTFLGKVANQEQIEELAAKTGQPMLVDGENAFAFECVSGTLLAGDNNERDTDGDSDDRETDGNANDRQSGGQVYVRKRRGSKNDRNRRGNKNGRDANGDANDRDIDGDANNRNGAGASMDGVRCSQTKRGRILLYSRMKINAGNARIYYRGKYYSKKYFKIIQL